MLEWNDKHMTSDKCKCKSHVCKCAVFVQLCTATTGTLSSQHEDFFKKSGVQTSANKLNKWTLFANEHALLFVLLAAMKWSLRSGVFVH